MTGLTTPVKHTGNLHHNLIFFDISDGPLVCTGWEIWMSINDTESSGSLGQIKKAVADAVECKDDFTRGIHPFHSHLVFYDETKASHNQPDHLNISLEESQHPPDGVRPLAFPSIA